MRLPWGQTTQICNRKPRRNRALGPRFTPLVFLAFCVARHAAASALPFGGGNNFCIHRQTGLDEFSMDGYYYLRSGRPDRAPARHKPLQRKLLSTTMPPSSRGLGYQVLILETGVRIPLGVVDAALGLRRGLSFCRFPGQLWPIPTYRPRRDAPSAVPCATILTSTAPDSAPLSAPPARSVHRSFEDSAGSQPWGCSRPTGRPREQGTSPSVRSLGWTSVWRSLFDAPHAIEAPRRRPTRAIARPRRVGDRRGAAWANIGLCLIDISAFGAGESGRPHRDRPPQSFTSRYGVVHYFRRRLRAMTTIPPRPSSASVAGSGTIVTGEDPLPPDWPSSGTLPQSTPSRKSFSSRPRANSARS